MAGGTDPKSTDPWAPPQEAVPGQVQPGLDPRGIHDSQTVTAMPAAGFPQAPPQPQPHVGQVPPPPVSPAGPGVPASPYGAYPQAPQPQPMQAYPAAPYGWAGGMPMQPSNGIGVAGMVVGIVSAVLCLFWPISIITGILAIVFGIIGRSKVARGQATNPGQALTGIICGSFGLVVGIAFIVFVVVMSTRT